MTSFMGHDASFWIELKQRLAKECPPGTAELLEEIVALRGKIAFYEERIRQMAAVARN